MAFDTEQGKALVASKSFWGTAILAGSVFLPKLRPFADDAFLTYAMAGIGTIVSIVGRLSASKPITGVIKK